MKQKENDNQILAWLWARAKGKKRLIGMLVLANAIIAAASSYYAVVLKDLVDAASVGDVEKFTSNCVAAVVLVVVLWLVRFSCRYIEEYSLCELENGVKRQLFSKLLTVDYAGVTATHSGEWLNRLTSDTTVVANGMTTILPGIVDTVVRLVTSLALMVIIAPMFGIAFIVGGTVVIGGSWCLRRILKRLHRQVRAADGDLRVFLSERLGSMMIIRAFNQEQASVHQADRLMRVHRKARMKQIHVSNLFQSGFGFAVNTASVLVSVFCGYGILTGTMSFGSLTAMLQLVGQAYNPIGTLSSYFPRYSAMLASAERLMEAERFAQEPQEAAVEDVPEYYRTSFKNIGLRAAGFTYTPVDDPESGKESRPTVLKNLDLQIEKGQYVAFCGPSGCGKSTVLKLLMSMYSLDEGQRYLTDAEGEQALTASWRGLFAYVPQGNHLMSGTIRDVVTFAAAEGKQLDEKVYQALKIACADRFISELPDGLDTQLGERGAGLSEGQMQRIAIARAIFSERPILLLDEATSALDDQTEAKLLDNLRSMTDKTVVIVTHRPAALEITDKIITFKPNEE